MSEAELLSILKKRFNLSSFRKGQLAILQSVLERKDALAVMPTGGGKSLCYQLPAVAAEGIVVVVSPLIALMNDQVRSLNALGIPAGCLHSGQTMAEKRETFARLKANKNFLLYLSPERVQKEGFGTWVKDQPLSLFAINESHCVSQWGPDFRKDYYRLGMLRELRPDVPILALTATATPPVLKDIVRQLSLKDPARHIHGFYRRNLYVQVETCAGEAQKLAFLKQALKQTPEGRVLVYCGTRKDAENVVNDLHGEFGRVGYYHAGMSADDRERVQKEYETGEVRILAATNAFGMGIDHPDVRLVVHLQMPANIESYYQEMGRAGRDGKDSTCLLLYSKKDKGLHSYFISQSEGEATYIKARWRALDTIVQFVEGGECRQAGILTYFQDETRLKECGHCDTCAPDSPRKVKVPLFAMPESGARKKKKAAPVAEGPTTDEEALRAELLKEWRRGYAEEKDIPAFLVFSNRTLFAIAKANPCSLEELREVHGMGDHKVEHLGSLILEQLESLNA